LECVVKLIDCNLVHLLVLKKADPHYALAELESVIVKQTIDLNVWDLQ